MGDVDLSKLQKSLELPSGYIAPQRLEFADLIARPLTRDDLQADLTAVNSSIELIRRTRGGSWPTEQLSEAFDFLDLAWHEREFRDHDSFAYVVYNQAKEYVGCFYLYPMGHRTPLTIENIDHDVDASWWVAEHRYDSDYRKLYNALQQWLQESFPFRNVYFSNVEVPEE